MSDGRGQPSSGVRLLLICAVDITKAAAAIALEGRIMERLRERLPGLSGEIV